MDSYSAAFQSIGLEEKTIANTLKSKKKAGKQFLAFGFLSRSRCYGRD